jgi:hypothetical protein
MVCGLGIRLKTLFSTHMHRNIWFFVFFFLFIINYFAQHLGYSNAFTRNYLDDILAMPIILFIARFCLRIIYQNPKLLLDNTLIILGFLFISVAFEWILPIYISKLTADIWDVFCYLIGTIGFWFFFSKN